MFGFCRFSGIESLENLIDSLNKVWIGKLCLHANVARFDKSKGFKPSQSHKKSVHKGIRLHGDDCSNVIVSQDDNNELKLAVLGCHKDFRAIANSNIICRNEGFVGVDVKYLGGLWVMFIFNDMKAKDSFLHHEGILSWFSSLEPWHDDFVLNERLVWLEIEGIPIRAWHNDTFKKY
ncbi:hypothetical protein Tco_1252642 [Tanacetum coccineum]